MMMTIEGWLATRIMLGLMWPDWFKLSVMRTSSEWLLIHIFTGFGTFELLPLRECQMAVNEAIIRNTITTFRQSSRYFERFQSGDVEIGF
jgi:hypothetical protein